MSRNHYRTVDHEPEGDAWEEGLYFAVPGYDNLFIHLIKRGSKERVLPSGEVEEKEPLQPTENVVIRYRKFTLTENPDTISYWSTLDSAYPVEFKYLTDYTNACTAWHVAAGIMGYSESECYIVCPSKLGFPEDQNTVTPYGYHLHMQIRR